MTSSDVALQIGRALWLTQCHSHVLDAVLDDVTDMIHGWWRALGLTPPFDVRARTRAILQETHRD